ncbi:MAG: glycosyltransferase [Acidimicrobiales bacterium]
MTPTPSAPLVSVVIPMQNEARHIGQAITAIANQSYGSVSLQLILVDGGSTDETVEVARAVADSFAWSSVHLVDNTGGNTPANLNAGLAQAEGEILVRVDARSLISVDHVAACVGHLQTAAVAGGRQIAIPNGTSTQARGIARALNNRFAMGGAAYRDHRSRSGPVDTVYLGSFRTDVLRSVGGWDEAMATNQDFDLNRRISAASGQPIWFDADVRTEYIGRATVAEFCASITGSVGGRSPTGTERTLVPRSGSGCLSGAARHRVGRTGHRHRNRRSANGHGGVRRRRTGGRRARWDEGACRRHGRSSGERGDNRGHWVGLVDGRSLGVCPHEPHGGNEPSGRCSLCR